MAVAACGRSKRKSRRTAVSVLQIIRERLDALLHASARDDALTAARHRAFMAPRLIGSLVALAAVPAYLALRGAPGALEVATFGWLIAPILASYYLSRTGRYEIASILSSLSLASLVMVLSTSTGGIESFAAVGLVLLPLEAALSSSRRLVVFASLLALACGATLIGMSLLDVLPAYQPSVTADGYATAFGIVVATLYAAALAFGAQSLARTSVALLSDEEDRYRLLAQHMSDVISRHRPNGAVLFISPAVEALLGVPTARLAGHGLFDRVHVADRPAYLTALSDAARGGNEHSVEFRLRREPRASDRNRRVLPSFVWIEMRCRPLEGAPDGDSGTEVVAVMRDITDRKMQEEALSDARAEAEQAAAAKNRFLATMSHELRTPLNAIIGFSEMIVREDEMLVDAVRRREYAQLINDSGQHLLSVVNGILDISKMEAGRFELSPEAFAPQPALMNCCNILALKARENGIELAVRAPQDLPTVHGDLRAFKQIVLNLVSNAIKFTERGGKVMVSVDADGARILLRVADDGIGIAEDDLKRIGDPFFQAGHTYQRRAEGTGLGLSIVNSLVSLHGGDLTVTSRLGEGTTVTVALPLEYSPPRPVSNIATLTPLPRASVQPLQVKKSA
jgi:cell cycle sensor histidine kinase DivJ